MIEEKKEGGKGEADSSRGADLGEANSLGSLPRGGGLAESDFDLDVGADLLEGVRHVLRVEKDV